MSTPRRKRNPLPAIAQAGPVSLWMILFVTLPMLFIIYISFMTRGTFGGVEYTPTLEAYKTMMDATYFAVILKSLQVAVVTTLVCLLLGYPFAYFIARKPPETASRLIMLLMIPLWTNSLMRLNAWMLLFQTNGPLGLSTAPLPSSTPTAWCCWDSSPTSCPSQCCPCTPPSRSSRPPCWRHRRTWGQSPL